MPPGTARCGRLPPGMIQVPFPEDIGAQECLPYIVGGGHRPGVEMWAREHIAREWAMVADPAL